MTPWTATCMASLSFAVSCSLHKLMSIELMTLSNYFILCSPLLLPSIFPNIRSSPMNKLIASGGQSQSFSISPLNEHAGLISFSIDWFDLPAVQGTLNRLYQHHSSKASILQLSAFFTYQLSHSYMTTGKTIALTRWNFVGKVMSRLLICCLVWS